MLGQPRRNSRSTRMARNGLATAACHTCYCSTARGASDHPETGRPIPASAPDSLLCPTPHCRQGRQCLGDRCAISKTIPRATVHQDEPGLKVLMRLARLGVSVGRSQPLSRSRTSPPPPRPMATSFGRRWPLHRGRRTCPPRHHQPASASFAPDGNSSVLVSLVRAAPVAIPRAGVRRKAGSWSPTGSWTKPVLRPDGKWLTEYHSFNHPSGRVHHQETTRFTPPTTIG